MSATRDLILGRIQKSLGRPAPDRRHVDQLRASLSLQRRNTIPLRAQGARAELIERFVAEAEKVGGSVARLPDLSAVPDEVANYLRAKNLPATIRVAPLLQDLSWGENTPVAVGYGHATGSDTASLTQAVAGVAETGTLLLQSGPATPTTLNFLPDAHIVVLHERDLVGAYEDGWQKIRDGQAEGKWPRVLNFVTGPSRTADIAQELIMGAHGPIHLHILLVADS